MERRVRRKGKYPTSAHGQQCEHTVRHLNSFAGEPFDLMNVCTSELTMDDVLTLSPKFWEFHQDPLMALDGAAMTLTTIQVNLTTGTIARHAVHRPELVSLVEDLLAYRKQ